MSTTDIKNNIDSEFKRVLIQNHPHYLAWFAALPPLARQMITTLMEEELTPADILLAQDASETEWNTYSFFKVIANGNPNLDNMPALTNFALRDVLSEVRGFKEN